MNDRQLQSVFIQGRDEIQRLRRQNEIQSAELNMAHKILNAIHGHHQPSGVCRGKSEDVVWRMREAEMALEEQIKYDETRDPRKPPETSSELQGPG